MEVQSNSNLLSKIGDWSQISIEDITAHIFFQKTEQTVEDIIEFLQRYNDREVLPKEYHTAFIWSVELRDFALFLRDSLLALVKYEQYSKDEIQIDPFFISQLATSLKAGSSELLDSMRNDNLSDKKTKLYKHQNNPVPQVIKQIEDVNIQIKKIYRSYDKINEIRLNLESFKREFYLSFQKQTSAIDSLIEQIDLVSNLVDEIHPEGTKEQISSVIDGINVSFNKLESLQSVESMEVLSYSNKMNLNIPVSVTSGRLIIKALNVQSEISKWFSGNVYPHIIELENRRSLALDNSINSLKYARVKLSALVLDEKETYNTSASEIKKGITDLKSEHIVPLQNEAESNTQKIKGYFNNNFYASVIYDDSNLFMPNVGNVQMTNISRDAQKRMVSSYKKYKSLSYNWVKNSLSKYIELDRTPHNQYISNKLLINKNDERLSLFLKKGYLGKTFSIQRPSIINSILNDYNLWNDGYSTAILIHGFSGSGKSALIGMLSQTSMTHDIVCVNPGEPYFTKNKSFDGSFNLQKVIMNIAHQSLGEKIVLSIDDLGHWHDSNFNLFDNISVLFELIQKFKSDIFFIVSCNSFLKERIEVFRDIDLFFSSQINVGKLSNDEIKEALMMRHRALPELGLTDTEHKDTIGPILRNANGNIGHAMLEYSRFFNSEYIPDLKSQDFVELIYNYKTILSYIICFHSINENELSKMLNKIEYSDFMNRVQYLLGLKILVYSKANIITVNPFLLCSIEKALKLKLTA